MSLNGDSLRVKEVESQKEIKRAARSPRPHSYLAPEIARSFFSREERRHSLLAVIIPVRRDVSVDEFRERDTLGADLLIRREAARNQRVKAYADDKRDLFI